MSVYVLRRVGSSLLTIALVALIVFFASRVLPGDPAVIRAGNDATPELIESIRAQYGLDRPLIEQFFSYAGSLLVGDFGTSIRTDRPVATELLGFLPATLELSLVALLISAMVGITAGVVAARWENRWPDAVVRGLTAFGGSMPSFWLSLLGIFALVYTLNLFPSPVGRLPLGTAAPPHVTGLLVLDSLLTGNFATAVAALGQLALPALILGMLSSVSLARITRAAMIDTLHAPHTRAARGLGLRPTSILVGEGVRNALPTIVTSLGLVAGHLIAGSIIVEQIFSWPGIGRYLATAITYSDLDVVQGYVILVAVAYVLINLTIDLLYTALDPRVKMGARAR